MSKKKFANPWNPSDEKLASVDKLKKKGYSYRDLQKLYHVHHTTIRRYLLAYRERKPLSFWSRLWGFFK